MAEGNLGHSLFLLLKIILYWLTGVTTNSPSLDRICGNLSTLKFKKEIFDFKRPAGAILSFFHEISFIFPNTFLSPAVFLFLLWTVAHNCGHTDRPEKRKRKKTAGHWKKRLGKKEVRKKNGGQNSWSFGRILVFFLSSIFSVLFLVFLVEEWNRRRYYPSLLKYFQNRRK